MDRTMPTSIKLEKIISDFNLKIINEPDNLKEIVITRSEVNRPGLALCGHYDCFVPERIQVIGRMEHQYLEKLPEEERRSRIFPAARRNS